MTKQEYLNYKQTDQMAILYHFYKERFDRYKHKPFLQRKEFDTFATMVMDMGLAYQRATDHYDAKFNVIHLADKEGKIIMTL
jgi:hypothetical protein